VTWLLEPNVCPGLFYGTPAQDGFLVRIRTPGGLLNFQQGQAIATLVEQWGSAAIQVTNRANLQIRSVHIAPTADVFQILQTLGLAAQNPSIDHLRNVMTSPTAGIDSQELIDTRPLVQAIDTPVVIQNKKPFNLILERRL
jgi:ferredoxin-nitrite reductase